MPIVPYDQTAGLFTYLDSESAFSTADREWLHAVLARFGMDERDGYTQALFVSYLLYICGDRQRMETVLARLEACRDGEIVPLEPAAFLETWYNGPPPAREDGFEADFSGRIRPRLAALAEALAGRAARFAGGLMEGFAAFESAARERLFLAEREIHMEELFDAELEGDALRWEYKYLGREEERILARRRRYLAAGTGEPLKKNTGTGHA